MNKVYETEVIFRDALAALNRADIDAVVEFFVEDGVVVDYSKPTVVHSGRAAIAALLRSFFEVIPDLKIELIDLVANEDRLAAELMYRGTPQGQTAQIEIHYCAFYAFRKDKFVSEHVYIDSEQILAAVGPA